MVGFQIQPRDGARCNLFAMPIGSGQVSIATSSIVAKQHRASFRSAEKGPAISHRCLRRQSGPVFISVTVTILSSLQIALVPRRVGCCPCCFDTRHGLSSMPMLQHILIRAKTTAEAEAELQPAARSSSADPATWLNNILPDTRQPHQERRPIPSRNR